MTQHILVIDDDPDIVKTLQANLELDGYSVTTAGSGSEGLDALEVRTPDLILLDLNLPDIDGIKVCQNVRRKCDVPVIMLSARDTVSDKLLGLECGADDYLVKPFSTEELLARLRALWRRKGKNFLGNTIAVNEYTLDPLKGEVTTDTETIRLSFKETQLLEMLMLNYDKVISKERLFERVWGYCSEAEVSNVELYVHYLRKKLNTWRIRTVRGVGYYWQNGEGHVS